MVTEARTAWLVQSVRVRATADDAGWQYARLLLRPTIPGGSGPIGWRRLRIVRPPCGITALPGKLLAFRDGMVLLGGCAIAAKHTSGALVGVADDVYAAAYARYREAMAKRKPEEHDDADGDR